MLTNETITKLHEMRLGNMATALSMQLDNPSYNELSFEDRLSLIVDAEWDSRRSKRLIRLIRNAGYAMPSACVENISYDSERHLNKSQILRLSTCSYIERTQNVIILGATGTGKTYLACALGIAANRNFYESKYIRLPDILIEIALARGNGTYRELMKKYKKYKLLILDEWLLYPLKDGEARDLLELVEARCETVSTIFCSQFDIPGWHELLYGPTVADAICDRITHKAHVITIKGESMRRMNAVSD